MLTRIGIHILLLLQFQNPQLIKFILKNLKNEKFNEISQQIKYIFFYQIKKNNHKFLCSKKFFKNVTGIMPMAGRGKRFSNYGYKIPKHLVKINNKPMFERAAMTFSKNIKWIFISQKSL